MTEELTKCVRCGSEEFIKIGRAYSAMKGVWWQKYKCKDCGKKFNGRQKIPVLPEPFEYQPKPIPTQNWSAYTQAQNEHKKGIMDITKEMLDLIEIKKITRAGRPNAHLKDICFALILKTFSQLSSRRLHGELELAKELNYIEYLPHFTVTMKYLRSQEMNQLLKELLRLSALPIKKMSSQKFSIDSTGFSTSIFGRWFDHKWGKETTKREWVKCHAMIENTSNVIVNATISVGTAGDSPRFEKLVNETSKDFPIQEVLADKAYSSRKNLEIVTNIGAISFIPFKSNARGIPRGGSHIWRKMYKYFKERPQEFLEHYHMRSNVETSFAMIKIKFGSSLASKTFIGQQNEILLKLIVHNCCCLIHEYYERNIENYLDIKNLKKIKIYVPLEN